MSIELTGVKKSYGKKEVLHGIDLSFGQGVYGLLGPNGAGKTTLMSIMTGLLEASAGDVKFSGMSITDKKSGYLKKLGFLPQYPGYYSNFTAWEFLEYMSVLKGIKGNNRKQIDSLLEFVNLTDAAWQKVGTFSGGILRRVGLAQTLLGSPEVIILDEPTAGLDPIERIRLRNLLSEIAVNRTVIIATHIVSDIEYIANEVILLFGGKVKAQGSPDALITEATDKVWLVHASPEEVDEYVNKYKISNILSEEKSFALRIVSREKPCENAVGVLPNLEDVFLWYSLRR